jgi:uncharacterized protein YndB with AHSA1/START domain
MSTVMPLPHRLDRDVLIHADRETVFRFFTDPQRWAAWWGAGSTIDARPGGRVLIRYPNTLEAEGEVLYVRPPDEIAFTYGYASGSPLPPGGSHVTIRLEAEGSGTRLRLRHQFHDAPVRDEHIQGWRYQLSLFANLVAAEVCAGAERAIDTWLAAWSESDGAARDEALARIAVRTVQFRDRFSAIEGRDEVSLHLAASQRFMPGIRMRRSSDVRQCQHLALADWVAESADGQERASGTNVFVFDSAGRIASVTGFWSHRPQH